MQIFFIIIGILLSLLICFLFILWISKKAWRVTSLFVIFLISAICDISLNLNQIHISWLSQCCSVIGIISVISLMYVMYLRHKKEK